MKKILTILFVGSLLSCTDHFTELNTDKKSLASVPGGSLFNNAMERFYHTMNNTNVNFNVFRLYAQYMAQTTYPEESQYNMVQRNLPDNWFQRIYRDALVDLKEARRIIAAEETNASTAPVQKNKLAVITINEVHMWHTMVDLFGDIPYTQALDFENPNPVYDDAQTIYNDLFSRLDQAIADLDGNYASFSAAEDLVNQGDTGAWIKAANSLKLRMAMRIADVDPAKSKSMAEAAVAAGVFSSLDESLSMEYIAAAPYTYPSYEDFVISGRSDYVAANTLTDKMNELNDPRRPKYFRQNLGEGVYEGGIYGTANSFPNSTQLGTHFYSATTPGVAISCSEIEFLKAEGAARGYAMGGTAEELYNSAVTASVLEWGGTEEEAAAYLAQPAVAYATATGDWKQKIGVQKWIALFGNGGIEGWTTWRLLDFNGFNVPEGLTFEDIPKRLIYPINEATLNGTNLQAAISAIGGDTPKTRLFWDKY